LTPETVPRNTLFKKAAIQEGPGRFREGKREGGNGTETVFDKKTQSSKVREGSGKGNGKVETDLPKTRNPGRSGKVPRTFPGRRHMHCKFRFYPFLNEMTVEYKNVGCSWSGRRHKIPSRDLQGMEICGVGHLRRQCNKVLCLLCWHHSFLKSCQWLAVAHPAWRLVARACQSRQTARLLPGSRPAKLAIAPAAAYAAALTSQQTC